MRGSRQAGCSTNEHWPRSPAKGPLAKGPPCQRVGPRVPGQGFQAKGTGPPIQERRGLGQGILPRAARPRNLARPGCSAGQGLPGARGFRARGRPPAPKGPRAKRAVPSMKNFLNTGIDGFAHPSSLHQKRHQKASKASKGPLKEGGPQDLSVPAMKNAIFHY